jgi:hypothetical protein
VERVVAAWQENQRALLPRQAQENLPPPGKRYRPAGASARGHDATVREIRIKQLLTLSFRRFLAISSIDT